MILRYTTLKYEESVDAAGNKTSFLRETNSHDCEFPGINITDQSQLGGFGCGSRELVPNNGTHWDLGSAFVRTANQYAMIQLRKKEAEGVISADPYTIKQYDGHVDRALLYNNHNAFPGHKIPIRNVDFVTIQVANTLDGPFLPLGSLETNRIPSDKGIPDG